MYQDQQKKKLDDFLQYQYQAQQNVGGAYGPIGLQGGASIGDMPCEARKGAITSEVEISDRLVHEIISEVQSLREKLAPLSRQSLGGCQKEAENIKPVVSPVAHALSETNKKLRSIVSMVSGIRESLDF